MGLPGVVAEVTAASVGRGKQVVRSRITRQIELHCTLKRVADVDARFRTSLSTFFLLLFLNCFVFSFFLLLLLPPFLLLSTLSFLLFFLLLWMFVPFKTQYHSFSFPPIIFLVFSFFVLLLRVRFFVFDCS